MNAVGKDKIEFIDQAIELESSLSDGNDEHEDGPEFIDLKQLNMSALSIRQSG